MQKNAKKADNFFKKFFKACLSTAHDTGSDQQNSEICCLFYGKKTNEACAFKIS